MKISSVLSSMPNSRSREVAALLAVPAADGERFEVVFLGPGGLELGSATGMPAPLRELAEVFAELAALAMSPGRSQRRPSEERLRYRMQSLSLRLRPAAESRHGPPVDALTRRETEVLRLLAKGNTNRQAAALLGLSLRTVENHRANLMSKLGLASRVELVAYAEEHDLL